MSDNPIQKDANSRPGEKISPHPGTGEHLTNPRPQSRLIIFSNPRPLSRLIIFVVMVIVALIALYIFFHKPGPEKNIGATETPPTLEKKSTGEDHDEHSQEGAVEVDEETAKLMNIKTEEAAQGEIEETISATGKVLVDPDSQAIVGAKVDGRALKVFAEPGRNVGRGSVLVVVDSPYVAEVRGQLIEARARFALAEQKLASLSKNESRAAVIQAQNRLDLATVTLERKKRLAAIGAAAGREVAEAEMEFKNAKAEFDYQSSIKFTREQQEASAEVELARATVSRFTQSLIALGADPNAKGGTVNITSPIAGTIVDRHITVGETVTPAKELLTVMNVGNVLIEAQFPESQANQLRAGQRLIARIPGPAGTTLESKVSSVGKVVNPQSRTVAVRARVPNKAGLLKHEMAVEVRIASGGRKDSLLIPVSALVDDEGLKIVYVREGTRYERRVVTVGTINFQSAEILSGLEAGDEVVTAGAYQLRNMAKGGNKEGGDHHDH
jgi:membrane fusion protein, heavy metal efflux system